MKFQSFFMIIPLCFESMVHLLQNFCHHKMLPLSLVHWITWWNILDQILRMQKTDKNFYEIWAFYKESSPFFAYTKKTLLIPGVYLHVHVHKNTHIHTYISCISFLCTCMYFTNIAWSLYLSVSSARFARHATWSLRAISMVIVVKMRTIWPGSSLTFRSR